MCLEWELETLSWFFLGKGESCVLSPPVCFQRGDALWSVSRRRSVGVKTSAPFPPCPWWVTCVGVADVPSEPSRLWATSPGLSHCASEAKNTLPRLSSPAPLWVGGKDHGLPWGNTPESGQGPIFEGVTECGRPARDPPWSWQGKRRPSRNLAPDTCANRVPQEGLFFGIMGTIWPINKDDPLMPTCHASPHLTIACVLLSAGVLEKEGSDTWVLEPPATSRVLDLELMLQLPSMVVLLSHPPALGLSGWGFFPSVNVQRSFSCLCLVRQSFKTSSFDPSPVPAHLFLWHSSELICPCRSLAIPDPHQEANRDTARSMMIMHDAYTWCMHAVHLCTSLPCISLDFKAGIFFLEAKKKKSCPRCIW